MLLIIVVRFPVVYFIIFNRDYFPAILPNTTSLSLDPALGIFNLIEIQ